jgi:hypothetical protein
VISTNPTSTPLAIQLYDSKVTHVQSQHILVQFHVPSLLGPSAARTLRGSRMFAQPANRECQAGPAGLLCPTSTCLRLTILCQLCRIGLDALDRRLLSSRRRRLHPLQSQAHLQSVPMTLCLHAPAVPYTTSLQLFTQLLQVMSNQPRNVVARIDRDGRDGLKSARTSCCQTTNLLRSLPSVYLVLVAVSVVLYDVFML